MAGNDPFFQSTPFQVGAPLLGGLAAAAHPVGARGVAGATRVGALLNRQDYLRSLAELRAQQAAESRARVEAAATAEERLKERGEQFPGLFPGLTPGARGALLEENPNLVLFGMANQLDPQIEAATAAGDEKELTRLMDRQNRIHGMINSNLIRAPGDPLAAELEGFDDSIKSATQALGAETDTDKRKVLLEQIASMSQARNILQVKRLVATLPQEQQAVATGMMQNVLTNFRDAQSHEIDEIRDKLIADANSQRIPTHIRPLIMAMIFEAARARRRQVGHPTFLQGLTRALDFGIEGGIPRPDLAREDVQLGP